MSQPGTLPVPTPGVPAGHQAASLAAAETQDMEPVGQPSSDLSHSDVEAKRVAGPQSAGPDVSGEDTRPCSYLSLFRSDTVAWVYMLVCGNVKVALTD